MTNTRMIMSLWPVIFILAGTLIANFKVSVDQIANIEFLQQGLVEGMNILYTTDLAYMSSFEAIDENESTKIRGNPISEEVTSLLDRVGQTEDFISTFKDKKGKIDNSQQDLLFNISCQAELITRKPGMYDACLEVSRGNGYVGVVDLNIYLYQSLSKLFEEFHASTKTPAEILTFYDRLLDQIGPKNSLQSVLSERIYLNSREELFNSLSGSRKIIVWMVIMASIVIAFLGFWAAPKVLLKVREQGNHHKSFYKLVPITVLLRNRWLKSYIVQTSGKLGEAITRAL
jgi:hypothetical protein